MATRRHLSAAAARRLEAQKQRMRDWFFNNFEDPAERTPYESAEGGYQWIWGGPYNASDELLNEFSGEVPDEAILELAKELNGRCLEWAPKEKESDYETFEIEDLPTAEAAFVSFASTATKIRSLINTEVDSGVEQHFLGLLHVSVITALETYLADAFTRTVATSEEHSRRLIETVPEFAKQTIHVSGLYRAYETLPERIRDFLFEFVWHNLPRVKRLYESVLGIDLGDIAPLIPPIRARHDIVHRGGVDRDGKRIDLRRQDLHALVDLVSGFVSRVNFGFLDARGDIPF